MGLRSQFGSSVREGLRPVVDLVYPPRCPLCGEAIAAQGGLCTECWSDLDVPAASDGADDGGPTIMAASVYSDASRKLVLAFKHGGKISLAPLLAKMIAAQMPHFEGELPILVPVPLHRWRLWQRGFNQAALLANELGKLGKGTALVDALTRQKRTPSLGGLGRDAREKVLSGAITARQAARPLIAGRDVILVDDVLTSGATSDACRKALVEAGAKTVRIACFARVTEGDNSSEMVP